MRGSVSARRRWRRSWPGTPLRGRIAGGPARGEAVEREPGDVAELTARVADELGRPLAAAIDEAKGELRRAKRGEAGGDPAAVAEAEVRLRLLKEQRRLLKRQARAPKQARRRAEDAAGEGDAPGAQDPPRRRRRKAQAADPT